MIYRRRPYTLLADSYRHTCGSRADWVGLLVDGCNGCAEAEKYPCHYCDYGITQMQHDPEEHRKFGDTAVPDDPDANWAESPHIYDPPVRG